jgi:hypothetical protein
VAVFEDLLRVLVEELRPQECALRVSNGDDLPVFARGWCKGGLAACVNCGTDPPVEVRPGDPGWFREAGVERRFVSKRLLATESVDPATFAAKTRRVCSPMAAGFVFDGEWDAMWNSCRGAS